MPKFALSVFLIYSLIILSVFAPVRAQSQLGFDENALTGQINEPTHARPSQDVSASGKKVDFKKVFEEETRRFNSESGRFDPDRIERQKVKQVRQSGWSKRDTALTVGLIAGIAVLVVLLVKYGKNCVETSTPHCNIGTDENCYCLRYQE